MDQQLIIIVFDGKAAGPMERTRGVLGEEVAVDVRSWLRRLKAWGEAVTLGGDYQSEVLNHIVPLRLGMFLSNLSPGRARPVPELIEKWNCWRGTASILDNGGMRLMHARLDGCEATNSPIN